jgi:hypothetical protein
MNSEGGKVNGSGGSAVSIRCVRWFLCEKQNNE